VVLIRDGDAVVVVGPGMVADRSLILDPLAALAVDPASVTDVVFSHHHPDHTVNAALFPQVRIHDFWAGRPADGFALGPSVTLMATPRSPPGDRRYVPGSSSGSTSGRPNAPNRSLPNVVVSATWSPSVRSTSSLNARNTVSPGRRR
jgi:hypothetical protein